MKNFIFYLAGAIFLFVSCQSDDLQIDDSFKPDNATKVTKEITFRTYAGEIDVNLSNGAFLQEGSGIASHIGQYTFVNTANVFIDFSQTFDGTMTAANGDQIFYHLPVIVCNPGIPAPDFCPGQNATFTYTIYGGTGRFEGATGELIFEGTFVDQGPFSATGSGTITY